MRVAAVLMTYGAPLTLDEVGPYLARVRGGREPSGDLVAEFRERYRRIGMSPIVRITEAQAQGVEVLLGPEFRVVAAMRYSAPSIAERVGSLAPLDPDLVVGVVMSPQWSPLIMGGYEDDLRAAVAASLPRAEVVIAPAWHREPEFIEALAGAVREARASLPSAAALLMTAHSLPRRVFDAEPEYVASLRETAELVAARLGLREHEWLWAYQSAGHTQEEWLRPDLKELFPALAARGTRDVLVVPVQFLADHLEVLYDLDVAAAAQAAASGLRYHRIAMPNTRPTFLRVLADVIVGATSTTAVEPSPAPSR
jgi:ferrochelatase